MKLLSYALGSGLFVSILLGPAVAGDITGAGETFPFPVYSKWAEAYRQETGIGLNHHSIGSGRAWRQIGALDPISTGQVEEPVEELRAEFTVVTDTPNHSAEAARGFPVPRRNCPVGPTSRIFMNPSEKRTRNYVTGRFG